ncbi:MAG TPA: PBP1A family penicillin-binding protein [Smithellaceae bacterium]|nr:MAG: Penicillin-binding protein 2D [Deltaproteobacteria bacterium ADurb.BinA014]HNT91513.1 PBP1A family penicillin-binding protein [Smithellaceae bacterium]HNV65012.1 PBP1A family penicillin-binding protein [Smithellaceae bacterium]HPG54256.1 PBP1A family penicillin-binding protein [Smithellaceae bacterium]HPW23257.1 PBP1A family penicillin-binding protein [Smithellaceae bacterium]
MPLRRIKYYRDTEGEVNKLSKLFILFALIIVSILFVSVFGTVIYYAVTLDLPSVETLKDYRPSIASCVYDDNDEIIDEFFLEDRKIVDIKNVPKVVQYAFVASEDSRFYQHKGFDIKSIFRAMFKNLEAGQIVQGGSTITQQVAKMMYLSPEKKYIRKLKEAILAYKIDKYLSKEEILNLYLNQIYLGHGTYGIESASLAYFGKSASELTLPEAALLAGLPKAPSTYSPFLYLERAKQRQIYVLSRMFEDGYITKEEMDKAAAEPLQLQEKKEKEKVAAYFVENVRRYVQEKYGGDVLYKEGLSIYTTLNLEAQKEANEAVEKGLTELEERQKYERGLVQGALICMDVKTGAIRAMVGGRDFRKSEFNRATQSRRQPGSAFKPLIYTAAFDKGFNPSSVFDDSPIVIEDPTAEDGFWRPRNFDEKFLGPITMRTALVQSRNVVTVKILQEIGPDYAASYAANMGITSPIVRTLSMALGSSGVTLQELVRAYGVLANGGKKVTPYFIKKIVDRTGNVFEENKPESEQVIDPRIAFMTQYIMRDVVESGTGRRVKSIGRPVAGKTGTTNDYRDAWFIGSTPSLITGVWVGFDQEISLGKQEVGGRAAAPIWLYFMEKVLKNAPVETFPTPEGIVFMRVNKQTGQLSTDGGAATIYECFLEGTKPSEQSFGYPEEKEDLFR